MKVEEIIEQHDALIGQSITIDGYLIVLEEAKTRVCYISSSEEVIETEQERIRIDHSIADLRTMIRPLPQMQLMFRGDMTNPPYFQRFKATLQATVSESLDGTPLLENITQIKLEVPYTGKTGEGSIHNHYPYQVDLDYTPIAIEANQRTARASVTIQKVLILDDRDYTMEIVPENDNRYARRLVQQLIQVSGWLESVTSENDILSYLLFVTTSLRASMVAVGPLREETSVLIQPSDLYTLIKAHSNRQPEEDMRQAVDVIGKVDYLSDDHIPHIGDKSPKLTFTEITRIIIHETAYLW